MSSPHSELVKPFIPLKRMGEVSEVASFVSYLASEEAGFITGASLISMADFFEVTLAGIRIAAKAGKSRQALQNIAALAGKAYMGSDR
jgi:hypothetical protein